MTEPSSSSSNGNGEPEDRDRSPKDQPDRPAGEHDERERREPEPPPADPGLPKATVVRKSQSTYQASVRWGLLRQTTTLATALTGLIRGQKCVVDTARGTELGEIITAEEPVETETLKENRGLILRLATPEDIERAARNRIEKRDELFQSTRQLIRKHRLPMKLLAIERLLGGERVVFFFRSEGRVDFRAMVRDLARRVRSRVEMRQIGARDEAKLLGDRADCGQPLCCRTFLETLEPIPMRFAKIQTPAADPQKISGVCGRLKCCLRYEYDVYVNLRSNLPERGDRIRTESGFTGRVVNYQILKQTVTVVGDDERTETMGVGQIVHVEKSPAPKRRGRKGRGTKGASGGGGSENGAALEAGGCGSGGCGSGGSGGCGSGQCGIGPAEAAGDAPLLELDAALVPAVAAGQTFAV